MIRTIFSKISENRCLFSTAAAAVKKPKNGEDKLPPTGMHLSAYAIYVKEKFPHNVPAQQAVKQLSQSWKSLSLDEKKIYQKKSEDYRSQKVAEFRGLSDEAQKQKIQESVSQKQEKARKRDLKARREEWKSTGHPKLPANAYTLFVKEKMVKAKSSGVDLSNPAPIVKEAAAEWNELGPTQRQPYSERAQKLSEEYHQKLADWKKEHGPKKEEKPAQAKKQ